MGTVGLNFGSPTSGTGFDVKRPCPPSFRICRRWKRRGRTNCQVSVSGYRYFQPRHPVIKSFRDVSKLTDFSGILAQKTGASSDTNVLQLTTATAKATAGTHRVIVNSLATTSSGYLTEVASASDTLTGSISVGVERNAPSVSPSGGTLASLASAINSSGTGILASVLTDPRGSRLRLFGHLGGDGDIVISANSLADAINAGASLSFTSTVSGVDASLTVDGVDLTSASNPVAI